MSIQVPDRYPVAEEVPEAGASCATCHYVTKDKKQCRNLLYQAAHGSRDLGAAANRWCCIFWSAEARS